MTHILPMNIIIIWKFLWLICFQPVFWIFFFRIHSLSRPKIKVKNSLANAIIKSWHSLKDNLISCLSVLFGSKESEINEDFFQLSELLEAKNIFFNRTELYGGKEEGELRMLRCMYKFFNKFHSNFSFKSFD